MSFAITGIYAALLTLVVLTLSLRVSLHRAKTGVSILHGGDMSLAQTIRHHGNITEYVPLALILIGICEAQGASPTLLHVLGAVLLVSRLVHPFGIKHESPMHPLRAVGHFSTFFVMLGAALYILWTAFL